jgi:DNA-binding MarR family transcriptional regulator
MTTSFGPMYTRQREHWRDAKCFQRRAQGALSSLKVSFSEWLLLSKLAELGPELGENVSQNALAVGTGMSRMVAGHWIQIMERKGWVDRGEQGNPRAWGVIITTAGEHALHLCGERLEAARPPI